MARHANQITLRDLDPGVLAEIERIARVEGLSLNKAAAKVLRAGAGLQVARESRRIGAAVDRFVGTLSSADAKKLSGALRSLEQVDVEFWK